MHNFAATDPNARADAIQETAARRSLHPIAVEKDFWVCWVLRELFRLPGVGDRLMFKGGTSLSKAYGAIERFSEDIDLSIHPEIFGLNLADEWPELTKSQRDNRIRKLKRKTREFVNSKVVPQLRAALERQLPDGEWTVEEGDAERDLCPIHFHYPRALSEQTQLAYAKPYVLIELTARAEHEPTENKAIASYVAQEFPKLVTDGTFEVSVLAAKRTFWEKVTILHAESTRPEDEALPPRLARHAYDLFQLQQCGIAEAAFESAHLLKRVCDHKAAFYPQVRVDYDAACTGALQIVPNEPRIGAFRRDYADMKDFFFGPSPSIDEIIAALQSIQNRANELHLESS